MKKEPQVTEQGIRCDLTDEFWILYSKEWDDLDARKFSKCKDDLVALRFLVEQSLDWHIPRGKTWEPIPFDKPLLLAQIDAFLKGESEECWSVPSQFTGAMIGSYYDAYVASCKLPLAKSVQS